MIFKNLLLIQSNDKPLNNLQIL